MTSTGKLKGDATRVNKQNADLVVSATDVATATTTCPVAMLAGAVYNPVLEIAPTAGLRTQVTPVLAAFDTLAVNCCV
jgi:hypothetical protein